MSPPKEVSNNTQAQIDECMTKLYNLAVGLYRPDLPEAQRRLFTEAYRLEDAKMANLNMIQRNSK